MQLKNVIGLGVAGNFAHHLEQAGELEDFKDVVTLEPNAPKGIFPFYLPSSESFLGVYSIGTDRLTLPHYESNAQVEPEIALFCDVLYDENQKVVDLVVLSTTAPFAVTMLPKSLKKRAGEQTPKGLQRPG